MDKAVVNNIFDFETLQEILNLNIGIAQRDDAKIYELLSRIYPMETLRFPSDSDLNGWVVPKHWDLVAASISKDGQEIFSGMNNIHAVGSSSSSFNGTLNKGELDKHINNSPAFPDAYVYNPLNNLRPWQERWSMSVPYGIYSQWGEGEYTVNIESRLSDSEMCVGYCRHQGETDETIVFNAHTCHPGIANDGFSGILVMLEMFKWLKGRKTRYSYLGLAAPEQIGSVYFVDALPEEELANIKLGVFLESVGSTTPWSLQQSFNGDTLIDEIAEYVLRDVQPDLRVGSFRGVVGNDETTWEAPGIDVPMVSVTRHPFPTYHTTYDNVANQSVEKLTEALDICKRIVTILEDDRLMERRFKGLVALSNPRHNLYRQRANPTIDYGLSEEDLRWGRLQDFVLRYFDQNHTMFHVANSWGIKFEDLREYLIKFEDKQLLNFHRPSSLDDYADFTQPPKDLFQGQ
jgi:aminopeptidase-like protein